MDTNSTVNKLVGFDMFDHYETSGTIESLEKRVNDLESFCLKLVSFMVENGQVSVELLHEGKLFISWGDPSSRLNYRMDGSGREHLPDYNEIIDSESKDD